MKFVLVERISLIIMFPNLRLRQTFIWNGMTIEGVTEQGVLENSTKNDAFQHLSDAGRYKIHLQSVSNKQLFKPLTNKEILDFIDPLLLMLDSGVSLIDSINLMLNDNKSIITLLILCKLRDALQNGKSMKESFGELSPLFSDFFISMIGLCEKTGRLREGLLSLKIFYDTQEKQRQVLERTIRYPKIILGITFFITLGIIIFVIPMFKNIYSLFDGDLPVITCIMVFTSEFIRQNSLTILCLVVFLIIWTRLPKIQNLNPLFFIVQQFRYFISTKDDPFLYAHSMKILLESGQSIKLATKQAADCLSSKNRKHGHQVFELLNSGLSLSEVFQNIPWFPKIFQNCLSSAEKAGVLQLGFEQVFNHIDRQRDNRFEKWSKILEPALMIFLGTVILVLLLAIYLPIFDLGNQLQ